MIMDYQNADLELLLFNMGMHFYHVIIFILLVSRMVVLFPTLRQISSQPLDLFTMSQLFVKPSLFYNVSSSAACVYIANIMQNGICLMKV